MTDSIQMSGLTCRTQTDALTETTTHGVTPGGDLRELQSGSAPDQVCVQRKIKLTLHRLTIIMINDASNPNHNHMCPWSTEAVIFVAIAIFFSFFFARFSNIVQTIHQWKYDLFIFQMIHTSQFHNIDA